MRLLQWDRRSTYTVLESPLIGRLVSVETHPYPKSQYSPLGADVDVSDMSVRPIFAWDFVDWLSSKDCVLMVSLLPRNGRWITQYRDSSGHEDDSALRVARPRTSKDT